MYIIIFILLLYAILDYKILIISGKIKDPVPVAISRTRNRFIIVLVISFLPFDSLDIIYDPV